MEIKTVKSIIGKPYATNLMNDIFFPAFSAMPTTITFAEAPIGEPLPPRHAPSASDHQIGIRSVCRSSANPVSWGHICLAISIIRGFMVAT